MNTLLFLVQVFLIASGAGVLVGFILAVYLIKHAPVGEETAGGFVEIPGHEAVDDAYLARVPARYESVHPSVQGPLHGSRPAW